MIFRGFSIPFLAGLGWSGLSRAAEWMRSCTMFALIRCNQCCMRLMLWLRISHIKRKKNRNNSLDLVRRLCDSWLYLSIWYFLFCSTTNRNWFVNPTELLETNATQTMNAFKLNWFFFLLLVAFVYSFFFHLRPFAANRMAIRLSEWVREWVSGWVRQQDVKLTILPLTRALRDEFLSRRIAVAVQITFPLSIVHERFLLILVWQSRMGFFGLTDFRAKKREPH